MAWLLTRLGRQTHFGEDYAICERSLHNRPSGRDSHWPNLIGAERECCPVPHRCVAAPARTFKLGGHKHAVVACSSLPRIASSSVPQVNSCVLLEARQTRRRRRIVSSWSRQQWSRSRAAAGKEIQGPRSKLGGVSKLGALNLRGV